MVARANLVPQGDATTLFTGFGMQPMIPYLLGEPYPNGLKRVADSQTSFRAEDIDEVGDSNHTTFFEMLGNWSFGDYFKKEQINWAWEFIIDEVGIDPNRFYVTCYAGNQKIGIKEDSEAANLWKELFKRIGIEAKVARVGSQEDGYKRGIKPGERIFYYDGKENWWSRGGDEDGTPVGDPCGPDSEMFYEFTQVEHDQSYGEHCHPACDCGRFIELGNNVFMSHLKKSEGNFELLSAPNIDHGSGLERLAMAAIDSPDVFKISLLWPIIQKLEEVSSQEYDGHKEAMRVIADHMRAAVWIAVDGVVPSNNQQGYVMRRLLRRAIRHAFELGITKDLASQIVPVVAEIYAGDFDEVKEKAAHVTEVLEKEEETFRQTLKRGLKELGKQFESPEGSQGEIIFKLYDTYGFPKELSIEELALRGIDLDPKWEDDFNKALKEQRERSRSATRGQFKGGLGGQTEQHTKYHTATHIMYKALRMVLGEHVEQRGSNITTERLRFDFNHHQKVTAEQLAEVEEIVNKVIDDQLPVKWVEMPTKEALTSGARGHFGEKYGDTSKVYIIGPEENPYSLELCGGPHVENTGKLGEGGKRFKIIKEQSSSAGIRRIKAVLK